MIDVTKKRTERVKTIVLGTLSAVFLGFVLPNASGPVIGWAAAGLFTLCFVLTPDSFRSRKGSMTPGIALLLFVWVCALVPTLLR